MLQAIWLPASVAKLGSDQPTRAAVLHTVLPGHRVAVNIRRCCAGCHVGTSAPAPRGRGVLPAARVRHKLCWAAAAVNILQSLHEMHALHSTWSRTAHQGACRTACRLPGCDQHDRQFSELKARLSWWLVAQGALAPPRQQLRGHCTLGCHLRAVLSRQTSFLPKLNHKSARSVLVVLSHITQLKLAVSWPGLTVHAGPFEQLSPVCCRAGCAQGSLAGQHAACSLAAAKPRLGSASSTVQCNMM